MRTCTLLGLFMNVPLSSERSWTPFHHPLLLSYNKWCFCHVMYDESQITLIFYLNITIVVKNVEFKVEKYIDKGSILSKINNQGWPI